MSAPRTFQDEVDALQDRKDIIQVRNEDQVKSSGKPSPLDTKKAFVSIDDTGITDPEPLSDEFKLRSVFPSLKPVKRADLGSLTNEYYLFHHGVWFTWGGLTYDPLLEFFVRDGESNKSVFRVPLQERFLYGVARDASELTAELNLFATPRNRMKDLLFWMDGVVIADQGMLRWNAIRQHMPLNKYDCAGFNDRQNYRYIGFYGFKGVQYGYKWFYHHDGFGCGRYAVEQPKPVQLVQDKQILIP